MAVAAHKWLCDTSKKSIMVLEVDTYLEVRAGAQTLVARASSTS